jgi:hypothetical protein
MPPAMETCPALPGTVVLGFIGSGYELGDLPLAQSPAPWLTIRAQVYPWLEDVTKGQTENGRAYARAELHDPAEQLSANSAPEQVNRSYSAGPDGGW